MAAAEAAVAAADAEAAAAAKAKKLWDRQHHHSENHAHDASSAAIEKVPEKVALKAGAKCVALGSVRLLAEERREARTTVRRRFGAVYSPSELPEYYHGHEGFGRSSDGEELDLEEA